MRRRVRGRSRRAGSNGRACCSPTGKTHPFTPWDGLLGVHHQTVRRCVERATASGAIAALDDLPRPGREPTIAAEAKTWLVNLACRKAKELGYPHELWTTRLLARHARAHGPEEGHSCLKQACSGHAVHHPQRAGGQAAQDPVLHGAPATPTLRPKWRKFCASIAR